MLEIGFWLLFCYGMFLVHPVFWMVVGLVAYLYYQLIKRENRLLGQPYNNLWLQVFPSLLTGLAGGIMASLLLVIPGFSLDLMGIPLMFVTAILLLLINPRFLCFAYSVGIVSLLIFAARGLVSFFPGEFPDFVYTLSGISIPGMLVLVAVLHLTEALLIFLGGHWGASPIYYREPGKEIMGGFMLQRFWLVPLVLLVAMPHPPFPVEGPEWWPILESSLIVGAGGVSSISLIPAPVVMGYSDMAVSSSPREKSIYSSVYLAVYGLILLGIAYLAVFNSFWVLPGVIFAPLGHELVVHLGNRRERNRPFRYRLSSGTGVKILAVHSRSPAARAGLKSEDIIREVDGVPVYDNNHFWKLIQGGYFWTYLQVEREGRQKKLVLRRLNRDPTNLRSGLWPLGQASTTVHSHLGIILAPDSTTSVYLEAGKYAPLKKIAGWLRSLVRL